MRTLFRGGGQKGSGIMPETRAFTGREDRGRGAGGSEDTVPKGHTLAHQT